MQKYIISLKIPSRSVFLWYFVRYFCGISFGIFAVIYTVNQKRKRYNVRTCLWYVSNALTHCWLASKHSKGMS